MGPEYVRPETPIANQWHTPLKGGLILEKIEHRELAVWWQRLKDPELSSLMDRAVAGNLDVKKAHARIREARARRGITNADLFPTLDASAKGNLSKVKNKRGADVETHLYAAGFDSSWEIDIFGGVRRSIEAAEADIDIADEDLNSELVSLLAETALNYIELRTYQARLAAAEANLEAQSKTCELTRWRHQAGLEDELSLQKAISNLENTRSQMPSLRTGIEEAKNRLAVLLGNQPGMLHDELEEGRPIPVTPLDVAVGVPADILRQRPDIRRAERQIAAQTARIGVAVADYYPKFKLSGSIGLETLSLKNASSLSSQTLGFGPSITWRIFNAGSIRQNIEVQSALQEQYLIAYEAAITGALEEVENVLTAYAEEQKRRQSLFEAVQAEQKALDLANIKYQAGLADFSDVLDSQRSLLSLQEQLAQSEGTVTSNFVRLYKTLGGGWTPLQ